MGNRLDYEKPISEWITQMPGGLLVYRADDSKEILYANKWTWEFFDCDSEKDFYQFSDKCFSNLIFKDDLNHVRDISSIAVSTNVDKFTHLRYRVSTKIGHVKEMEDYAQIVDDIVYGKVIVIFMVEPEDNVMISTGTDEITGLLRIGPFYASAQQIIQSRMETDEYYVIYFNVRGFNLFNVKYSDENGNWLLRNLADMLQLRFENCLVSRYAEDHFVVLTSSSDLTTQVTELCDDFKVTYSSEAIELQAGICKIDEQCDNIAKACDCAKLACDVIRDSIGEKYCFYDENIEHIVELNDYVVHALEGAIKNGQIRVFFQPIYRTLTNALCEFEALARWEDPDKGLLEPVDFIRALEESHQIYKLDIFMVNEVCRMMRERMDKGGYTVPVSLNISRIDLLMCDMVTEIENALNKYDIPREMIHIEITESALLGDTKKVLETSKLFRETGYQVWMDDFGEGYSSLNMLDRCDFDLIKLDMGFLDRFNDKSKIVIENVVRMTKKLGVQTLAEGVETAEQYDFLRRIGCEKVQGYYLGKPMELQDVLQFLEVHYRVPEDRKTAYYFDKIGQIEFTTDKPLAIYELSGSHVNILYWNEYFLNVFISTGLNRIEEIQTILNDQNSSLSVHFRNFLKQIQNTERIYEFDYTVRQHYIRLRIRKIVESDDKSVYQIENMNLTNDKNVLRTNKIDYTNHTIALFNDTVFTINLKRNCVSVFLDELYLDNFDPNQEYYDIAEIAKKAAVRYIHPEEIQEYLEWVRTDTIIDRIKEEQRPFIAKLFRTRERDGSYVWKNHRIMVCPGTDNQELIYTINYVPMSVIDTSGKLNI